MAEWYTSIRISSEQDFILAQLPTLFTEEVWYIAFPHMGRNGDNPHYHVFIKHYDDAGIERYRRKLRTAFGVGNRFFSIKRCKNGIAHAIQYGSKEGTDPATKGDVQQWIDDAPAWIPGARPVKRKRNTTLIDPDGDEFNGGVRVNKYNLVGYAYQFWKKNLKNHPQAREFSLAQVFRKMFKTKDYSWHFTEKFTEFQVDEFRGLIDPSFVPLWCPDGEVYVPAISVEQAEEQTEEV